MEARDTARAAFAIGWASATKRHPVTLTERAKAGCSAAMTLAEHLEHADVVEATINLGALEGIWAVVYDRREQAEKRLKADLDALLAQVDAPDPDSLYRYSIDIPRNLGESKSPKHAAAIIAWLRGLTGTPWWSRLRVIILDAIATGRAEGRAQAIALIAHSAGASIDFDIAFTQAYDALIGGPALAAVTDEWTQRLVGYLADELGSALGVAWQDGATGAEMASLAADILGSGTTAASYVVDQAVGQALSQGQLDVYQAEGMFQFDFITAGDSRVCPICDAYEAQNPHPAGDVTPPVHGGCRCTLAPALADLQSADLSSVYADFIVDD